MASKEKEKSRRASESAAPHEPVPPDGGYGWVVLLSSFLVSFILDGVMYSFGFILQQIKLQFNEPAKGNLLSSLNTGFLFCSGPIVAGLTNQFGCRVVVVGGAIFTSLMYVLTAFAPNIYVQMVTFGVLGGISTGCTYIASIIVIAHYFEKKRGIATGITMSGSGFGGFAFAPFLKWLLDKYDWKYTMVIMACIILQCAFLGALLRPLKASSPKKPKKQKELQNLISEPGPSSSEPRRLSKQIETFTGSVLSLNTESKSSSGFIQVSISILKEMTDLSLLVQSIPFLLVTLSNFFIFLGYFVPFIYMPEVGKKLDIPNYPLLLSIIGIVNIPFRMLYGLIADRKIISAINLNTLACLIATIPFFFYWRLTTFHTQAIFSVSFAVGVAGLNSLTTMYLIEMVGLKKFNAATGIINLFRGFGCFCGAPIAGLIVKSSSNLENPFNNAFFYSGGLFAIGFILAAMISFWATIKSCCNKNEHEPVATAESSDTLVATAVNFDNAVHEIEINNGGKLSAELRNSTGLRALVRCATLTTESQFVDPSAESSSLPLTAQACTGSDVDVALLKCCESLYPKMVDYRSRNRKAYENPKNKSSQQQTYVYETDDTDNRYLVAVKGALADLLPLCNSLYLNGNDIQLDDQWKSQLNALHHKMSATSEKIVCFCDIRLDPAQYPADFRFDLDEMHSFTNLRFLGMVALVSQQSKVKQLI